MRICKASVPRHRCLSETAFLSGKAQETPMDRRYHEPGGHPRPRGGLGVMTEKTSTGILPIRLSIRQLSGATEGSVGLHDVTSRRRSVGQTEIVPRCRRFALCYDSADNRASVVGW